MVFGWRVVLDDDIFDPLHLIATLPIIVVKAKEDDQVD